MNIKVDVLDYDPIFDIITNKVVSPSRIERRRRLNVKPLPWTRSTKEIQEKEGNKDSNR